MAECSVDSSLHNSVHSTQHKHNQCTQPCIQLHPHRLTTGLHIQHNYLYTTHLYLRDIHNMPIQSVLALFGKFYCLRQGTSKRD